MSKSGANVVTRAGVERAVAGALAGASGPLSVSDLVGTPGLPTYATSDTLVRQVLKAMVARGEVSAARSMRYYRLRVPRGHAGETTESCSMVTLYAVAPVKAGKRGGEPR